MPKSEVDLETALYEARSVMCAPVPHASTPRLKLLAAGLIKACDELHGLRAELAKVRSEARVT